MLLNKGLLLHAGLAFMMILLQSLDFIIPQIHFAMLPFDQMHDQWWRLLTGHFIHTNVYHLMLNLAGLLLVYLSFMGQIKWQESALVILILCLSISICLGIRDHIVYYGFSGVLHGYLAYLLLRHFSISPKLHLAVVCGLILKVVLESFSLLSSTEATAALIDAPVATQSHAYGILTGLCLSMILKVRGQLIPEG